jgi:putative two-component system response regulator
MSGRLVAHGTRGAGEFVVVIDDHVATAELVTEILTSAGYRVTTATSGVAGLALLRREPPDLVELDVALPDLDGYAISAELRHDPVLRRVPIILLTTLRNIDDRLRALHAGADEFISKPVEQIELLIRVRALIRLKREHDEVDRSHQVLISLALALEARDPYTRTHSQNVAAMARRLAAGLGLGGEAERQIEQAGLLHDIGKVVVPDTILMKAGPLTDDEFAIMRTHPVLGYDICCPLATLRHALGAIRHHHEWWNGRGYPDGLAGETIPLAARIMAIADAYDAMTSDRPYRDSLTSTQACQVLSDGAGSQWDPALVDAFLTLSPVPAAAAVVAVPA